MSHYIIATPEGKTMTSLYTTAAMAQRIAESSGWVVYDLQALAAAARTVH